MNVTDLVMWTLNGESTLDAVLKRINEVVPSGCVNNRFIVDDGSSDCTVEIAERNGWDVKHNCGRGISDGANTALSNVETEFFCSFEQDVLLSSAWWSEVAEPLFSSKYAVASGVRFSSQPNGLIALQKFTAKQYMKAKLDDSKRCFAPEYVLGKTLDNTIYRTCSMREIGGFPKLATNAGVDTVLIYRLLNAGYIWRVNYAVHSIHIREGLTDELRHHRGYGQQIPYINRYLTVHEKIFTPFNRVGMVNRLLYSPIEGLKIALKTGVPTVTYIYPLIRWYYVKGMLEASAK
jgi:glycosyltransferase involved in cell wall biosynthesis